LSDAREVVERGPISSVSVLTRILLAMAVVLVTGGTGTLGRTLVPKLVTAGHEVQVLSRREAPPAPAGVVYQRGDVRTGDGVDAAARGADVIIHAASSPQRRARETEEAGARHVAAAAKQAGAHLLYVSIVGVDRHRFPYYRAKLAAEHIVAGMGADWTVLRATQFHELIDMFLSRAMFIRTRHLRFQPVEVREVAARLVELVAGPAQGLVPDFGGPEVLSIGELAATRHAATGRRTRLLPLPAIGFLADFDAGRHLTPDHRAGTGTWQQWLDNRQTTLLH
jgi:uncharacterized protein YbjT (DUF2867 family)